MICLDFGGAYSTYIESGDDWIDDPEEMEAWFSQKGLSEDELTDWATERLTVIFDGEMDCPENFKSIKVTGIYGPNLFSVDGGLTLTGFSIYCSVETTRELDDEELEDLFHSIVPVIKDGDTVIGFTEFDDYSLIEDVQDETVRAIEVNWPDTDGV